jgi:LPS-assembly lipoprotein
MWSHETGAAARNLIRMGAALLLAGLTAGCFQPLYGERTLTGGPGLAPRLAAVQIAEIPATPGTPQARLAVELRNELAFALTNGESAAPPTHRLDVTLRTSGSSLIVDPSTARAEFEVVAVEATYKLVDLATKKPVMDGSASARTSFDVPGQQQRYTALRGRRDAQSRGTKVISEQIRNRLVSYFAAGS